MVLFTVGSPRHRGCLIMGLRPESVVGGGGGAQMGGSGASLAGGGMGFGAYPPAPGRRGGRSQG
jgi:hypothetical protein